MKLDFCAVCGSTKDLHQHHIEPVVFSKITRKKSKRYDGEKKLKDCDSTEVFAWLFDQGVITDDGEITVCSYHHNILHGIVKFQTAAHSTLIKEGIKNAKENGVKMGRPTIVTSDMRENIRHDHEQGTSIRSIAKKYQIGIGTVYSVLKYNDSKIIIDNINKKAKEVKEFCERGDIDIKTLYDLLETNTEDEEQEELVDYTQLYR
jgi:hypothetical protein